MRRIYLLRHATPQVRPEEPSRDWPLSPRGVTEAEALARTSADWGLHSVYSSSEAKARSTALIVADAAGAFVRVVDAFDELPMPWVDNADEFNAHVRSLFAGEPVRDAEPADAAAQRFARGMAIVAPAELPAAVVTHGRVLTSYLASLGAVEDAFSFWRSLPMPAWGSIDLDARGARMIVEPFR